MTSRDCLAVVPEVVPEWDFSGVFVDWLHIRQVNDGRYSPVNSGRVIVLDQDGIVETDTAKSVKVEGSFDSSIRLRVTDELVEISGNPARFDRDNNLLGYSFEQSVAVFNRVLARFDLPPLVPSSRRRVVRKRGAPDCGLSGVSVAPGFRVLRVDATLNVAVGRWLDAYFRMLRFQKLPRRRTVVYPNTVYFDMKSSTVKVYRKGREIRDAGLFGCRELLADWCDSHGVARIEVQFKREYLKRVDLQHGLCHAALVDLFKKEVSALPVTFQDVDVSMLNKGELGSLLMWSRGFDVREYLSRNQWFKHKRRIKEATGFDIGADAPVRFEEKRERIVTRTFQRGEYPPEAFPDFSEAAEIVPFPDKD